MNRRLQNLTLAAVLGLVVLFLPACGERKRRACARACAEVTKAARLACDRLSSPRAIDACYDQDSKAALGCLQKCL